MNFIRLDCRMKILLIFIYILALSFTYAFNNNTISDNVKKKQFIYDTYMYDTIINLVVNETTEQILDFEEVTDRWRGYPTRVHVSTDFASEEYPLLITARQQKGISSWDLPLIVKSGDGTMKLKDMARTLCPHDAGPNVTTVNRPTIELATANPSNVTVAIKVRREGEFYVEVDREVTVEVSPSTPKFYYFSFDSDPWNVSSDSGLYRSGFFPRFNYTIPKSVILTIESDDELCAVVSVQNNSCPVVENLADANYQGYHLTMMDKGGITLTQSMFPTGFYVVFMVRETDEVCTGAVGPPAPKALGAGRIKRFRFRVIATISYKEYAVAALVLLAVVLLLYALVVAMAYCRCRCTEEVLVVEEEAVPSTSRDPIICQEDNEGSMQDEEEQWMPILTVAGLSRAKPDSHARRSARYFWSALTVAVVYALPVLQLLVMYQRMVFETGDQDVCYYNFLCAHPLGPMSDFNHVYSNIGYVVLGLLFMLQVRSRQRASSNCDHQDMGIPQHAGLFYSMGVALVMEGLLSACYHLCPNKMNFQFDSSFMYVIAVLVMVKLYQSRHPDVNASAHSTFALLALVMALGLVGILWPTVYFWVVFTALHIAACLYYTLKIYYVGQFSTNWGVVGRAWGALRVQGRGALRPNYGVRAILLALANCANWALAGYGMYAHSSDFARHLLAVLLGNALLYTLVYVVMKLAKRERLHARTWLWLALAHAAWLLALALFADSRTKWSQTPAQSRRHNAPCTALLFYDTHDLWHVASAAALFLSFNLLLTVDDALESTPRHLIPVF